jgi:anti-sigma regulatory factor (Ser/Thr protein kinase)
MQLTVKLTMNSDPRLLRVVRSAVEQFASVCGFPEEQCRAITLAVDEAVCNVIRHAYHDKRDQQVELTCRHEDRALELVLVDHGQAVDRTKVCSRPLDEIRSGGLGTHIIRQAMDDVSYESLPGGNRLRLVKYLPKTEKSGP